MKCRFGDIASFRYGKLPLKNKISNNGKYPIFSGYRTVGFYDEYNISENQLVIVVRGVGGTGDVKLTKEKCYLTNLAVAVDFITDDIFVKYIYYYFLINNLRYLDSGSAQSQITISDLKNVEIDLPDLRTQKKIAKILSALDDKIECNNQINKNLEEQAKNIILDLCNKVSGKVKLSSILDFANGFAFQSKSYLPQGKYKIITIKNVQDGEIISTDAACLNDLPEGMKKECILAIGDVLVSLTGNVGRVGIVCENNLLLNQRVAKFVPLNKNLIPFLYFYFRLESTKQFLEIIAKGTAQQNLSPIETLKIELPYDSSIIENSSMLKSFFDAIVINKMENLRLSKLRDTLLPKLMSGELDVDKIEI